MANARKIAVTALQRVNCDNAYSNITLNEILSASDADSNERALATLLFYGVLDRKITLDYVLNSLIKSGIKKLKPLTLETLRVALYQLMYTDKIPPSAAVNEAVKIIKKSKESFNTSFVNGVLRNFLRNPIELPQDNSVKSVSIRYSCPEWIIDELYSDYDVDTVLAFLENSLKPAPLTLRVNTAKLTADELITKLNESGYETEKYSECTVVVKGSVIKENELFYGGAFFVQDLSSQKCAETLSVKKGERILDMCAAPGGKSFTMAVLMENDGEIVSCDIHPHRTKLILDGAKRLGLGIIKPLCQDATVFNSDLGEFDAVLCDVPCSGLGIIRRKPDIKYKEKIDFTELESIQLSILENAARYVKKGGRIVYSTCTLRKNENERIINAFLDKNSAFSLKESKTYLPQTDMGDGFFTALLIKK